MPETAKPNNRLLAALPKNEYRRLFPKLERISLVYSENIYEPGDIIRDVYFPESGIISLLSGVDRECTVEVGIVGKEGMAGLPVFLGVKTRKTAPSCRERDLPRNSRLRIFFMHARRVISYQALYIDTYILS